MTSPMSRDEAARGLAQVEQASRLLGERLGRPVWHDVAAGVGMGVLLMCLAVPSPLLRIVAPLAYFAVGASVMLATLARTGVRPGSLLIRSHPGYVVCVMALLVAVPVVAGLPWPGRWWWVQAAIGAAVAVAVPMRRWRERILCGTAPARRS